MIIILDLADKIPVIIIPSSSPSSLSPPSTSTSKPTIINKPTPADNSTYIQSKPTIINQQKNSSSLSSLSSSKKSRAKFSRLHCINDNGRMDNNVVHEVRSCHFQSMCYSLSSKQFHFYHDIQNSILFPPALNVPITNTSSPHLPCPLLNLRSMGLVQHSRYFCPVVIESSIPTHAVFSDNIIDPVVIYHPHYPANIGQ